MKITIKDITLTDMLQADVDNTLVQKMSFPYNNIENLLDCVLELDDVVFNIVNKYENREEYFILSTSYGNLKLNRNYFHSVIIE